MRCLVLHHRLTATLRRQVAAAAKVRAFEDASAMASMSRPAPPPRDESRTMNRHADIESASLDCVRAQCVEDQT